MGYKPIIVTVFLFFIIWESQGQSLDYFLNEIEAKNLNVKLLEQEYEVALERVGQVGQMPDPTVKVGVMPLPVETRLGPQWARFGVQQQLPRKAQLQAEQALEQSKAAAKYDRIAVAELDLSHTIKTNYYLIYELEKSRTILDKSIRLLDVLERLALANMESGKGSMVDVLRIQLQREVLEERKTLLDNKKAAPQATINQVIRRPLASRIELVDSLALAYLPYEKDSLASLIRQAHPMFKSLKAQQAVSTQAMKVNALSKKSVFGVGMDYIVVTKRKDANPKYNGRDVIMPHASVKVPLNRKKYEAKDREEELNIALLEVKKQAVLEEYLVNVEKAYIQYKEAKIKLEAYKRQRKTLERTIDLLVTQYSVTGKGFDELLGLYNDLVVYDIKVLKAIVLSHLAKAEIERFF